MFTKKEIEWILCGLEILKIEWENQINISKNCFGGTGNIQDEIESILKTNKELSDIKALINKIENIKLEVDNLDIWGESLTAHELDELYASVNESDNNIYIDISTTKSDMPIDELKEWMKENLKIKNN